MKCIVGLGNPGKEYEYTRHNIGFIILSLFQEERGFSPWSFDKYIQADISKGSILSQEYLLVKPQTFMNLSAQILPGLQKKGIGLDDIIVVYDDLAYPFGTVRISYEKGAGGHNGIKSFIAAGCSKFVRVRIGIHSKKEDGELVELSGTTRADFVLKEFRPDEKEYFPKLEEKLFEIVSSIEKQGISKTMTEYNIRK